MYRDFNLAPDASIDIKGPSPRKPCQATLIPFLHAISLFGIWRYQHAMERDFTFFSKPHCTYSRTDLFVGDKQLLQDATETNIQSITWSDHAPISMTLGDRTALEEWSTPNGNPHLKEYFDFNKSPVTNPST